VLFVLHPTERAICDANQSGDWNKSAYVLLLKGKGFKTLIAGDIDDRIWAELCQWASREITVRTLISGICVFKASHHGRRSGCCGADWLRLTNPDNIVISEAYPKRTETKRMSTLTSVAGVCTPEIRRSRRRTFLNKGAVFSWRTVSAQL
jgi:hypothetical protein